MQKVFCILKIYKNTPRGDKIYVAARVNDACKKNKE